MGPRTSLDVLEKTKISCPYRHFFVLHFFILFFPSIVYFCIPSRTATYSCTTQTQTPMPGGIRTCNPSKLSTADPHLRPLHHWDCQDSNLQPQQAIDRRPSPQTAPPLGLPRFESAIPAGEWSQTSTLDRPATGIGKAFDPRSVHINYSTQVTIQMAQN